MVIDTSALLAILFDEPERPALTSAIDAASARRVSAMSKLEASIVAISREGGRIIADLDDLLHQFKIEIVPFDEHQADIAREAFTRYGKGRHKAGLNFGDCAAYALAVSEAEPLLFKGRDFSATDVEVAGMGEDR